MKFESSKFKFATRPEQNLLHKPLETPYAQQSVNCDGQISTKVYISLNDIYLTSKWKQNWNKKKRKMAHEQLLIPTF
jgi:hypothetical protein